MTAATVTAKPHGLPRWLRLLSPSRASALYLWLGFVVVFSLASDQFLTATTWRLVFSEGVVTAVLALAFLVPFVANTFDLSIGAVMGLSLVITNWLGANTSLPAGAAALAALAACALTGAVSGFVVVKLRVNSFVATLGVSQLVTGLVILISDNRQITGAFSELYEDFGRRQYAGVPVVVLYLLVIAAVVWFVLDQTPLGRRLYATGGNAEAARLAGVRTDRLVWSSLIASATMAGFAGVLFSMKTGTFSTSIGPGYLFPAVAAVFFGASQFTGRPNVWGTIVAYYALAFGIKGLQLVAGPGTVWIGPVFEGTALLLAVALASRQGHIRVRRAQPAAAQPPAATAPRTPAETVPAT
jgi:ribose transport system permease protein